jgi:hypothetical protein
MGFLSSRIRTSVIVTTLLEKLTLFDTGFSLLRKTSSSAKWDKESLRHLRSGSDFVRLLSSPAFVILPKVHEADAYFDLDFKIAFLAGASSTIFKFGNASARIELGLF